MKKNKETKTSTTPSTLKNDSESSQDNSISQIEAIGVNDSSKLSPVGAAAGYTGIQYKGLGTIHLGDGLNIQTGKIKYTDSDESLMLLDQKYGYKFAGESYEDFSEFYAGKSNKQATSKSEAHGGASVSYGLARASAKYAHEEQEAQSISNGCITKTVGVVRKKTYYLPYNCGENGDTNETSRIQTAELLLAGSPAVADLIKKIRAIKDDKDRQALIFSFYREFGSHFVSSVTKGYIGYYNVLLEFKGDQSLSSNSNAGSVSVGYLGLGAVEAGFSNADSETFSKTSYTCSSRTYAFPNSKETLDTLERLKKEVDDNVARAQNSFDFKNSPIDMSKVSYPNLPNTPAVPQEDKEDSKAKSETKKKMKADLSILSNKTSDYLKLKEKENAQDKDKLTALLSEITSILLKFEAFGEYSDFSLSSSEFNTVEKARTVRDSQDLSAAELKEELEKVEKAKKEKEAQEKIAKEDTVQFSAWLKKYHEEHIESEKLPPIFSDWFKGLTAAQTAELKEQWENEIMKPIPQAILTLDNLNPTSRKFKESVANSSPQNNVKASVISTGYDTQVNPFTDLATLDYNIVPWSDVFPELSFMLSDNSMDIILIKLYKQLNDYFSDCNYLNLVSRKLLYTKTLIAMQTQDKPTKQKLEQLFKDLVNCSQYNSDLKPVIFGGNQYAMNTFESIMSLSAEIESVINKTSMMKSNWYIVVKKLKEMGLIKPCGVMLSSQSTVSKDEWQLMYGGARTLFAMGEYYDGGFSKNTLSYNKLKGDRNFGQQIADYSKSCSTLTTLLPLVSETSEIKDSWITDIYFINESGNDINNNPTDSRFANSINPSQCISINNSNSGNLNEAVYDVRNTKNKEDFSNYFTLFLNGNEHMSCFNNSEILKSKKVNSLSTNKKIKYSLVPITDFIIDSYVLSEAKPITMNVFYSSGNNLPFRLYNEMFN